MPRTPLPFTRNLAKFPWKQPPRILTKEKVFEISQDYRGRARNVNRISRNRVEKGLQHAYRNRKVKRRNARKLWIQRVNAGARLNGLKYSQLISGLKRCNIDLNRKMLTDLAINEPLSFAGICQHVRLRPDIKPKIYPSYGYVQSAVVTQKILKPTKHIGRPHENAFLKNEHANMGEILTQTNFRLPMYMDYTQIELPTRSEIASYYKQVEATHKAQQKAAFEETSHQVHPDHIITSRDVPRGKVRSHWTRTPKDEYVGPALEEQDA